MPYGLKDTQIDQITAVFAQYPAIDQVVLYGSRAIGTHKPLSDIDLTLYGDALDNAMLQRIGNQLDDLLLPYTFDLSVFHMIDNQGFVAHIERVGVVVWEREEWTECELGDVINLKRGYDLPSQKRTVGSYPIISSSGVTDYHSEFMAMPPGVITGRYGTIGQVFYAATPYWPLNTTLYVEDFKRNFPKFIYYFLKVIEFEKYNDKSTVPGVNRNELHQEKVTLPPLTQQRAISSILTSLDDKIDLLHRQNVTLEQMAEVLFRQWFVEEAGEEVELESLVLFEPKEKIERSKEYTFFDMKCLSNDSMLISEGITRRIDSATAFRNLDTLLAKITPCLENGKTGFVMHLKENEVARGSTEFVVMRPQANVSPYFVYCLSRSEPFRDHAISSMTGSSGRQRVQVPMLRTFLIGYNHERNGLFHEVVHPFFSKIKSNQTQIRTLTALRDTLLPKLMSGELRVKK
jgi:type I restriction enzyme, S subunit